MTLASTIQQDDRAHDRAEEPLDMTTATDQATMATTTISQADGVHLILPDSLDVITPYVLMEQEDWFEDELRFLRRAVEPGQQVIDIGANYGVYALSLAKAVGEQGRVWAFEPASSTAALLARSATLNGFSQLTVRQAAVSSEAGTASLALEASPECNALLRGQVHEGAIESVPMVTLDQEMAAHGWQRIDVLKIDAEGEETRILAGARQLLAGTSPLVMYEARAEGALDHDVARALAAQGYASYRLVPGLGVLVPFDAEALPDEFLLNLFACKPDRAALLATRGLLLTADDVAHGRHAVQHSSSSETWAWPQALGGLAYARGLAERWSGTTLHDPRRPQLEAALALHAMSRDPGVPMAERYGALAASVSALQALCDADPAALRHASLARVASEHGDRMVAVRALRELGTRIIERKKVDSDEPFLAPLARFDDVSPGQSIGNWALGTVLEALERQDAFSSFYTGKSSLDRLKSIQALGFASPEMLRRLKLVEHRHGQGVRQQPHFAA
jgi:FkbM family methyltransferase